MKSLYFLSNTRHEAVDVPHGDIDYKLWVTLHRGVALSFHSQEHILAPVCSTSVCLYIDIFRETIFLKLLNLTLAESKSEWNFDVILSIVCETQIVWSADEFFRSAGSFHLPTWTWMQKHNLPLAMLQSCGNWLTSINTAQYLKSRGLLFLQQNMTAECSYLVEPHMPQGLRREEIPNAWLIMYSVLQGRSPSPNQRWKTQFASYLTVSSH